MYVILRIFVFQCMCVYVCMRACACARARLYSCIVIICRWIVLWSAGAQLNSQGLHSLNYEQIYHDTCPPAYLQLNAHSHIIHTHVFRPNTALLLWWNLRLLNILCKRLCIISSTRWWWSCLRPIIIHRSSFGMKGFEECAAAAADVLSLLKNWWIQLLQGKEHLSAGERLFTTVYSVTCTGLLWPLHV